MATKSKGYRGDAYWERETPQVVDSGKIRVSLYAEAGKLQISQLFTDRDTGELRRGKTVTLDQEDMTLHREAAALVRETLAGWWS